MHFDNGLSTFGASFWYPKGIREDASGLRTKDPPPRNFSFSFNYDSDEDFPYPLIATLV